MKKILISFFALTLLGLTSCTDWDHSNPNMPAELRDSHQTNLDGALETLKSDQNNTEAMFNAAYEYQELGDYKSAVDYYKKVLAITPDDVRALNNIADIYEQVGDYDSAAENIKKLYKLKQDDVEVVKDAVRILLEDNNPANAQEALENYAGRVDASDTALGQMISDLFQQIVDYKTAHPDQK